MRFVKSIFDSYGYFKTFSNPWFCPNFNFSSGEVPYRNMIIYNIGYFLMKRIKNEIYIISNRQDILPID